MKYQIEVMTKAVTVREINAKSLSEAIKIVAEEITDALQGSSNVTEFSVKEHKSEGNK